MLFYGQLKKDEVWLQLSVLRYKIFQKEGGMPLCNLVMPFSSACPIFIKSKFFEGKLTGLYQDENFMRCEYQMEFDDIYETCLSLVSVPEIMFGDPMHPSDRLEGQGQFFHFNRKTKQIELTNIIKGKRCIEIKEVLGFYQRTIGHEKIKINLKIIADWFCHEVEVLDLWPLLEKKCPNQSFETLTASHFKTTWPKIISSNPRIRVLQSELKEKKVGFSGPFMINGHKIYCKESVLSGTLQVQCFFTQHFRELFHIALGEKDATYVKNMCFYIPKHIPKGRAFFTTSEGKKWLKHAVNLAYNYYIKNSRCFEIKIKTPIIDITLDDEVSVRIPKLGLINAKITEYEILDDGFCILTVRYGCSLFQPKFDWNIDDDKQSKVQEIQSIVDCIEIQNLAFDQQQFMLDHQTTEVLPTNLKIHFRKNNPVIEREYYGG